MKLMVKIINLINRLHYNYYNIFNTDITITYYIKIMLVIFQYFMRNEFSTLYKLNDFVYILDGVVINFGNIESTRHIYTTE